MKLDTELAFSAGAAIISGVAAAVIAPQVAAKLADTTKPENWYATGAVAVALGAGIMILGSSNGAAKAAGAAMVGAGASFAYLGYQGYAATKKAIADKKVADANTKTVAGNVMGAFSPMDLNQPKMFNSWSGVPATAQNYARMGGMPIRSR
jgi:uncharacterized membrane protein YebE (DUF533 family)